MTEDPGDRPLPAGPPSRRAVGPVGVMAEQCLARSPRGVVLAAAPEAAVVGVRALAAGGDAHDAALAAALAETVLLPPKCGLGGDLVALVWPRGASAPEALVAVGGAPAALAEVAAAGRLSDTGPTSVGVPGAPAGYAALAGRGRLGLAAAVAPAAALARDGFCWATIDAVLVDESADLLRRHQPDGCAYLPPAGPVEPGAVVRLPGLARALEHLAAEGAELLAGPVGRAVVERVRAAGGVLTLDDLATARAEWVAPAAATVAGHELWATPAPTHGPSLLDAVSALPVDRAATPADVHAAVLAAIARRRDALADPSGTSMVSAVDADGTLVTVVHSNSYPRFGSGLVVDEFELVLANRAGRGFNAEPGHPNFPAPGRRPATTLHAWGWAHPHGARLLGATPGGANQMPWNAQALARLLAPGTGADAGHLATALATAVVAPRWEWDPADDGLRVEAGFDPDHEAALAARVGRVDRVERWALRSAMQIVADADGVAVGAVDPRTVGAALPA